MSFKQAPIPSFGIPFNLGVAIIIGILTGIIEGVPTEHISDILIFALAAGFFVQEVVLVQYFSREANLNFQSQLLKGNTSTKNRNLFLFVPFISLLLIGILMLMISEREVNFVSILRVAMVAVILTLGLDPLMGLASRGPLAVFGASLVYIIVIDAGVSGYGKLSNELFDIIGGFSSIAFSSAILTYLLLSTRWTYYRLFCFGQIDQWKRIIIDTAVPLAIIVLPSIPDFIQVVQTIFVGV